MRTFKKFLALVLAMLMVGAMAVSAAYTDQDAINATGYAEAVAILSDLKVMQGSGDGSFNPNGTLTRAEAAVIAAKLDTGAAGQKIDWTSASCSFADVDAAWSYAYINYASQHGIMDGIGDGKFNPNGTLTIAEAIVLAVKAAGYRADVAKLDEVSKPSYWATNWIAVADAKNLTRNIVVFDYTAPCSRAMMAQIAYNIFDTVEDVELAFNMLKVSALVSNVGDSKVTLDVIDAPAGIPGSLTVDRAAFEAAMAATGATGNADSVKGAQITMTYSKDNGTVYGVTKNSNTLAFNYADAKLANVKENNANTVYVTLDGQKYIVADRDESNTGVIGATSVVKAISITKNYNYQKAVTEEITDADGNKTTVTNYITSEKFAPKESVPTYYSAVAYDDNADGYYDRVELDLYNIGTLKAGTADARTIDGVTYTFDTIYDVNGGVFFTNYAADNALVDAINYTGAEFTYGEVPVLYHVAYNAGTDNWDVDILEVASTVTGKLTAISNANGYVTIDGTSYGYAAEKVAPESWTLNQTVTIYTVGGRYVKFASESRSTKTVIVNNVVANEDGSATVTGYDVGNTYAEITLNVVGVMENGKLVSKTAHDVGNAANTDAKKYAGEIALGTYDANASAWKNNVQFTEGGFYKFYVTAAGAYCASTEASANVQNLGAGTVYSSFEVKGGYVYTNGSATHYTDNVVILELIPAAADNYNAYADTYNRNTVYHKRANVNAFMQDTDNDNKIELVYVSNSADLASYATAPAEGQTIVQILSSTAIEEGFDFATYNAIDLMTGAKVVVKSTIGGVAGQYYVAKDGALVNNTTNLWVKTNTINAVYDGLIGVVKADTTKLATLKGVTAAEINEEDVAFGVDQITIYKADANGIIVDGDSNGAADTLKIEDELLKGGDAEYTYVSYIVKGKMIVIINK